jgi:hypothetical protein
MGHFRPFNNVCVMSAFHPIATKLLHYGKRRDGPGGDIVFGCSVEHVTIRFSRDTTAAGRWD